jgi:hypothetical protein
MKPKELGVCWKCGVKLQGQGKYCVKCYCDMHRPCPECMIRNLSSASGYLPRTVRGKPVRCKLCRNRRWILMDGDRIIDLY